MFSTTLADAQCGRNDRAKQWRLGLMLTQSNANLASEGVVCECHQLQCHSGRSIAMILLLASALIGPTPNNLCARVAKNAVRHASTLFQAWLIM